MRKTAVIFGLLMAITVINVHSLPVESSQQEGTVSRTWEAIKDVFRPVKTWVTEQLPRKTPADIADDVQETFQDAREWAAQNPVVETVRDTLRPVQTWVQDTAKTLQDKTFREMWDDTVSRVRKVDDQIGGWIDENINHGSKSP